MKSNFKIEDKVIIKSAFYGWANAKKGDIAIINEIYDDCVMLTLSNGNKRWRAKYNDIELYEEQTNKLIELRDFLLNKNE